MLPIASYNLPSRAPQRLVNCYAEPIPGKDAVELRGVPGIVPYLPLTGGGRGLHVFKGQLVALAGTGLYVGGTNVGEVPGAGRLSIMDNGAQLVTENGYVYDGATVAAITDPDRVEWATIDFCDGYLVAVEAGSGRFIASKLYDPTDYDALKFATAEGSPDDLLTLVVDHRQVILIGTQSTEIWWNTGQGNFPFERTAGGFLELGGIARRGVCKIDHTVFMLAADRTVRALRGNTWVRVSQIGVEAKIASYDTVSDCVAFSYTWAGALFAVFSFPSAGATWALNITTGEWCERESYGCSMWNIVDAVTLDGRVYVQHSDGAVGYLDDDTHTEFGGILRREWTYQPVYDKGRRVFHSMLEVGLRTGAGPVGVDPYVHLEISDDGGNTWLALPRRLTGTQGRYVERVKWHRLGSAFDRVYRMSVSDAVPVYVTDTVLAAQ